MNLRILFFINSYLYVSTTCLTACLSDEIKSDFMKSEKYLFVSLDEKWPLLIKIEYNEISNQNSKINGSSKIMECQTKVTAVKLWNVRHGIRRGQ